MVTIKRVYEKVEKGDGFRILVDRLWPRGLSKEKAHVDLWMKEIAPSTVLRKWFGHNPAKWEEFRKRYGEELKKNGPLFGELRNLVSGRKTVTLLYGAKDTGHNQAVILRDMLR